MTCDPQSLLEAARCFSCIPAGMLASVGTNLLCQLNNIPEEPLVECTDPQVDDWLARIDADPLAVRPPDNVIEAVCIFCHDLRAANIFNKMYVVNPVIPPTDGTPASLRAMQYPLIYRPGNGVSPFINNGFVIGDLNINGLRGSGTSGAKYMDTRFETDVQWDNVPFNVFAGHTVYESEVSNDPTPGTFETEIGCVDEDSSTTHQIGCINKVIGGFTAFCWTPTTDIVVAQPDTPGYYSANRQDLSTFNAYQASSTIPHHLLGQNLNVEPNPVPALFEYFMCQNDSGAGAVGFTAKRVSFMSIHEALTQPESLAFYNAIQRMRMSFGGGFV